MAKGKEQTDVVRLPLHRAALFFVPDFSEDVNEWKRRFEDLLQKFIPDGSISYSKNTDDHTISVRFKQVRVEVDRASGHLDISYDPRWYKPLEGPDTDLFHYFGPRHATVARALRYRTSAPTGDAARPILHERRLLRVRAAAYEISEMEHWLRQNLRHAISQGAAQVMARVEYPTAPFTTISSLKHFKRIDRCDCRFGGACHHFSVFEEKAPPEGRPPQRLYDVHVAVDRIPVAAAILVERPRTMSAPIAPRNGGYNWKPIEDEITRFLADPGNKDFLKFKDWNARLRRRLEPFCRDQFKEVPAPSTMKFHVSRIVERIRETSS